MKYNLLTIIDETKIKKGNCFYLTCKCDCGTIKEINIKNLKSGQSKSCGCIRRNKLITRNLKHGKRFSRTWRIWQAMKNRCYNKNTIQYKNYGGRGIKVCDKWLNDFNSFYNDVGEAPLGRSLDRINNDGNYEPKNVKWSTSIEQGRNKSTNRKINGVCISEISKSLGGGHSLVTKRLKRGWDIQRAITEKTHASK